MRHDKIIIGVTGGIGSGKTTFANLLAKLGCAVISADKLNHEILKRSEIKEQLKIWWGEKILAENGEIDRKCVAGIVFRNENELKKLTALLHPLIDERQNHLIAKYTAEPEVKAIVLDTPLLFEVGMHKKCDSVIFVDCPDEIRLERVKKSRGWDKKTLKNREKFNLTLDSKAKMSDHRVVNNSGVPELAEKVAKLLSLVLEK